MIFTFYFLLFTFYFSNNAYRHHAFKSFTRLSPVVFRAARFVFRLDDVVYYPAVADASSDEFERDGRLYLSRRIRPDGLARLYRRRAGGRARQAKNAASDRNRADLRDVDFTGKFVSARAARLDFIRRGGASCRVGGASASGFRIA